MPKRLNEIKRSNRSSRSIASLRSSRFTAVFVGEIVLVVISRSRSTDTITVYACLASKIFLSSLKITVFQQPAKRTASSLGRAPDANRSDWLVIALSLLLHLKLAVTSNGIVLRPG